MRVGFGGASSALRCPPRRGQIPKWLLAMASQRALWCAAAVASGFVVLSFVASSSLSLTPRVELTYWEEQTRLPSRQQRWFQWMQHNDAGPPVGALGHGWDGVDRTGMFPGDGATVIPRFPAAAARTTFLDELDPLKPGSDTYLDAHKYLDQLREQSIAGQKAYVAKKQAAAKKAMKAGIKQAQALWAYTQKHGYGRDLTKQYWANLKALSKTAIGH